MPRLFLDYYPCSRKWFLGTVALVWKLWGSGNKWQIRPLFSFWICKRESKSLVNNSSKLWLKYEADVDILLLLAALELIESLS